MTTTKQKKNSKIRHLEYYDLQNMLDTLYADSGRGKIFNNLMPLIESEENIRLAYRNIKRNSGSNTSGVDKLTIKDIETIPETKFVEIVRKKLQWYKPKAVRRVEIPKPNGKDVYKRQDMALAADTASICEGKAGQEETEDVLWG